MKYTAKMEITDSYFTVVEANTPQEAKAKLIDGQHGEPLPGTTVPDGQWMPFKRRQIAFEVIGKGDLKV